MSIGKTLFPPANREAALVAFIRTFWQTVRATGLLGGAGAIVVSAADLQHLNLTAVAFIAGAVLVSGVLSGLIAAGDILTHGLPNAYQNAVVASIPVAQVDSIPPAPISEPLPDAAAAPAANI